MTEPVKVTTPSDREIAVSRVFDAPADVVFDFHTKPELVQEWLLGPPGWTMPACEIDLNVPGRYRYVWRSDDGSKEFGVQGTFREIDKAQRLVHTETMDGVPGEALCTLTFVQNGSRTTLTTTMLFESQALRDGALESGMTDGMSASYDRLESYMNEHGDEKS